MDQSQRTMFLLVGRGLDEIKLKEVQDGMCDLPANRLA